MTRSKSRGCAKADGKNKQRQRPGAKARLVARLDVRAEARTYLKGKGKGKFFAALRMRTRANKGNYRGPSNRNIKAGPSRCALRISPAGSRCADARKTAQLRMTARTNKGKDPGLKPGLVARLDVRAEARTYLRGNSNNSEATATAQKQQQQLRS